MSVQSWSSSRFSTCSSDRPSFAGSARWKRKKSLPADSSRATSDSLLRRSSVLPMRWMPCANTSFTRSPVSMIMSKLWRRPLLAKEEDEADAPAAFTLPAADHTAARLRNPPGNAIRATRHPTLGRVHFHLDDARFRLGAVLR
uniref:Uncharacterized protein n=1 Tax=Anopheles christyi TaxID=43041 RepID=A0A182KIE6_9DIPT